MQRILFALAILVVTANLVVSGCINVPNFRDIAALDFSPDEEDEFTPFRKTVKRLVTNNPARAYRTESDDLIEGIVTRVISGDTIEVEAGGEALIVGYEGIAAPELDHISLGEQPYARQALERNRELVEGKLVKLEADSVETDSDGRQLRYVYLNDIMVNALLVYEGMAQAESSVSRLASKHTELLFQLQNVAVTNRSGGWETNWLNLYQRR